MEWLGLAIVVCGIFIIALGCLAQAKQADARYEEMLAREEARFDARSAQQIAYDEWLDSINEL